MSLKREMRDILKRYEKRGWRFDRTGGGHLRGTGPRGQRVFGPVTPSDRRGVLNFRAEIRRKDRETGP